MTLRAESSRGVGTRRTTSAERANGVQTRVVVRGARADAYEHMRNARHPRPPPPRRRRRRRTGRLASQAVVRRGAVGAVGGADAELTERIAAGTDASCGRSARATGDSAWDAFARVDLVLAGLAGAIVRLLVLLGLAPPLAQTCRGLARLGALAARRRGGVAAGRRPGRRSARSRGSASCSRSAARSWRWSSRLDAGRRAANAGARQWAAYTPPPAPRERRRARRTARRSSRLVLGAADAAQAVLQVRRVLHDLREADDRDGVLERHLAPVDLLEEVDELVRAAELGVVVLDVARGEVLDALDLDVVDDRVEELLARRVLVARP